MPLDLMNIVVRLHNIPVGLRKPNIARRPCANMGTVVEVIPPKGDIFQVYMCVRMQISVTEPFQRGSYLRTRDGRRH